MPFSPSRVFLGGGLASEDVQTWRVFRVGAPGKGQHEAPRGDARAGALGPRPRLELWAHRQSPTSVPGQPQQETTDQAAQTAILEAGSEVQRSRGWFQKDL